VIGCGRSGVAQPLSIALALWSCSRGPSPEVTLSRIPTARTEPPNVASEVDSATSLPEVGAPVPPILLQRSNPCFPDGGTEAATEDASATARPLLRKAVDVTFGTAELARTHVEGGRAYKSIDAVARLSIPALSLDETVFNVPALDPHHCCADVGSDSLEFHCGFSGIDIIASNGRISREGDALVVHWCTADEDNHTLLSHRDIRAPLASSAPLRFHTHVDSCSVPYEY
jgi:hypothetical protein